MGTFGEGGMITTDRKDLYERMLSFRSLCCLTYDPKGKYLPIDESINPMGKRYWYPDFDHLGLNSLHERRAGRRWPSPVAQVGRFQRPPQGNCRSLHQSSSTNPGYYVPLRFAERQTRFSRLLHSGPPDFRLSKEGFMWELYHGRRIKVWSHYMPIHLTTAYRKLGHREGEYPVAEALYQKYVSLPIHPRMTVGSISYVIDSIRELA